MKGFPRFVKKNKKKAVQIVMASRKYIYIVTGDDNNHYPNVQYFPVKYSGETHNDNNNNNNCKPHCS